MFLIKEMEERNISDQETVTDLSLAYRELQVIEYPGNVQNVDNMLETLGGIKTISQVFCGEMKRVELKFQPKNEFCKAVFGDLQANTSLMLKIKIRRSKRNPSAPATTHVKVLGHCRKVYLFESLTDYQYLPIVKNDCGKAVYIRDEILPKGVTDFEYFSRQPSHLLCVPYQFARSDSVHPNIHRIDPNDDGLSDTLGVLQKPIYDSREVVGFSMTDQFPTQPDPAVAKRMKVKYVTDDQLKLVQQLFQEHPCWTRFSLVYETGFTIEKLKHILPSVSYLFSNGPWRTLYVRYGYDPRKDFNSRYYQTFDFRLRFRTGLTDFVTTQNKITRIQKKYQFSADAEGIMRGPDYPYLEEGKLPRSRQWILRYCDIKIDKIKEMLDKIPSPLTGVTCNERTGWLPLGFDAQVRQVLNNSFKETMREYYAKQKLQSQTIDNDEEFMSDLDNDQDGDFDECDDEYMDADLYAAESMLLDPDDKVTV